MVCAIGVAIVVIKVALVFKSVIFTGRNIGESLWIFQRFLLPLLYTINFDENLLYICILDMLKYETGTL